MKGDGWVSIDETSLPWMVEVRVETIDGVPRLVGLRLEPKFDSKWNDVVISKESLRRLSLRHLVRQGQSMQTLDLPSLLMNRRATSADLGSREHLREVAEVYTLAVQRGESPRPVIAAHWGRSTATVDLWLKAARAAKFLGPARPGRATTSPTLTTSKSTQRKKKDKA